MVNFLQFLRWTARLSGLLVAAAFAFFMIGELTTFHAGPQPTLVEWIGIALLTVGAFALLFGWRWELQAGLISLAALVGQAILFRGDAGYYLFLIAMAIPGIMLCLDWVIRHRMPPVSGEANHKRWP